MLGDTIKNIRVLKNVKQKELADFCKISPVHMNFVENNKKNPSPDLLQKISLKLEIPLSILTFLSLEDKEVYFKNEYEKIRPIVDDFLLTLVKHRMEQKHEQKPVAEQVKVKKPDFVNLFEGHNTKIVDKQVLDTLRVKASLVQKQVGKKRTGLEYAKDIAIKSASPKEKAHKV